MRPTNMTIDVQRKRAAWLDQLGKIIDDIGKRSSATLPDQEEFDKAALLRPNGDISHSVEKVSLYHVDDAEGRHMIAVADGGDIRNPVLTAECSCGRKVVCSHLLGVLAVHPGRLAE